MSFLPKDLVLKRSLRQIKQFSNQRARQARHLSRTPARQTDGVFRKLTEMRVPTPWIDALQDKKRRESGQTASAPSHDIPVNRERPALTPKRMSDSYYSVVLPLAQDRWLSDSYLNADGNIRLGALFMDLDALSGVVAYRHTGEAVTTVTAAFDRISLTNRLDQVCDLELSGQVTYVGKSSMEIELSVRKVGGSGHDQEDLILTCACTMVSLDPITKKPVPISPLIVETDEEKRIFANAESAAKKRKELRNKSLRKHTPDTEETQLIHKLWQNQLSWHDSSSPATKPSDVTWMDSTHLHTAAIMQPQYRNRHHFMIFGGFLLRSTYELAFCCAANFAHSRPRFLSLDPSTFETPVPVGSVLYLSATVVYTNPEASGESSTKSASNRKTRVLVRVNSYVRNVEHGERKPTGTFNYSFEVDQDIKVMPRTYGEFMMWIDARRRAKSLIDMAAGPQSDAGVVE